MLMSVVQIHLSPPSIFCPTLFSWAFLFQNPKFFQTLTATASWVFCSWIWVNFGDFGPKPHVFSLCSLFVSWLFKRPHPMKSITYAGRVCKVFWWVWATENEECLFLVQSVAAFMPWTAAGMRYDSQSCIATSASWRPHSHFQNLEHSTWTSIKQ